METPTPLPRRHDRLPLCLLLLRWGVFIVMLMWTLDKFLYPEHAAAVFKAFYFIGGLEDKLWVFNIIGTIQLVIILGFLAGVFKMFTYGAVLFFHAVSTFSSFARYLDPFTAPNLLFFAAIPMLAACFTLFYMRDCDILLTFGKSK
ncbi:MAG: hypothetical protein AAGG51_23120 [Cyanobacteria bacterium P01_G01_bin.54]